MSLPKYDNKSTLLEDVYEVKTSPHIPVVIIDFKVYAHAINKYAELAAEVAKTEEELSTIMKAMWAYKLNRGPDMLEPFPHVGVVVDDMKGKFSEEFAEASTTGVGYWRHIEAHKIDLAEYKGGRGEKTPYFYITEKAGYDYIKAQNSTFPYFYREFFEADDLAGLACRLKRNSPEDSVLANRQMILSTVDGDWQGLASDSHDIVWANTGPWLPRLRSEREVCDYYLRKDKLVIDTAQGCYAVKCEVGDSGDNLSPGTPLRFFDLYNEDHEWRFPEDYVEEFFSALSLTTPSNRSDHFNSAKKFLSSKGLFLPVIGPAQEEEKRFFFAKAIRTRVENLNKDLKGRNKTACMKLIDEDAEFKKCAQLARKDESIKFDIETRTIELNICKDNGDKKCEKDVKKIISKLKETRKTIKSDILEIVNIS